MGEILIPRRTKVEKGYELLADITVGTATTSVDITGLNIGKGDEVLLVSSMNNVVANTSEARIFINGNTTVSNYYTQRIYAMSTSRGASRFNSSTAIINDNVDTTLAITTIKLTNSGFFVCQSQNSRKIGTGSLLLDDWYATSTFTVTSITSLKIESSLTNAIGIGSRFQLYKIN